MKFYLLFYNFWIKIGWFSFYLFAKINFQELVKQLEEDLAWKDPESDDFNFGDDKEEICKGKFV